MNIFKISKTIQLKNLKKFAKCESEFESPQSHIILKIDYGDADEILISVQSHIILKIDYGDADEILISVQSHIILDSCFYGDADEILISVQSHIISPDRQGGREHLQNFKNNSIKKFKKIKTDFYHHYHITPGNILKKQINLIPFFFKK